MQCFEALVRDRATESQEVVLALTNAGFVPFWHNFLCSLERVNVSQHAILIGTDADACDAAARTSEVADVPCVIGDALLWDDGGGNDSAASSLSQHAERHGTVAYARLMHIKARPALAVLRMGFHLLFSDIVIWVVFKTRPIHLINFRVIFEEMCNCFTIFTVTLHSYM